MLSRPASATLSDPVKVRTMIRPKRTSETRSIGSNTRLEDRSKEFSGMGRWKLNSYEVFSLKRLPNSLLTTTKKTPVAVLSVVSAISTAVTDSAHFFLSCSWFNGSDCLFMVSDFAGFRRRVVRFFCPLHQRKMRWRARTSEIGRAHV